MFSVHPVETWNTLSTCGVSATRPPSSVFSFVSPKVLEFQKTHEKREFVQQTAANGSTPGREAITILIGTGSPCCSLILGLKISQG